MTTAVIQSGFWKTGVFPYNPGMIKHSALVPSTATDNLMQIEGRNCCGVNYCFSLIDLLTVPNSFSAFMDCFSSICNSSVFFTDQARAIHEKVAAGGVGLQGAVGGVQLAGGVIVAQAPYYSGDNDGDSDEDSDVSYTKTLSTRLFSIHVHIQNVSLICILL